MVRASERKVMAKEAMINHDVSISLICRTFTISETCYRYQPKLSDDNELIADLLLGLTQNQRNWGFGLCFLYLRNVKGYHWNHKRVYRIYRELELNMRIKPNKRLKREVPEPLAVPEAMNECWSMDFMSDSLYSGKSFRTFNVIDDYNRESLAIEVDSSLPSQRIIRVLDRIAAYRGYPKRLRQDNGPEFVSHALELWAEQHGILLDFIKPGKPTQNAYIERFNRTYRNEVLDCYLFNSLTEVRELTDSWMVEYNYDRPHESLNDLPPKEYERLNRGNSLEM